MADMDIADAETRTPDRAAAERVVLFDLPSLRFRRDSRRRRFSVLSAAGEVLAGVANAPENPRAAALAALDEASRTARCWRDGELRRVAFYNPHTAEASVGPSDSCTVFRFDVPPPLSAEGTAAVVCGDELHTDDIHIARAADSAALIGDIRSRIAAHRS